MRQVSLNKLSTTGFFSYADSIIVLHDMKGDYLEEGDHWEGEKRQLGK